MKISSSQARLRLALGYTMPIVGAAVATVLGLILNDLIPQDYSSWSWVIVMSILGASLVLGTRFSNDAYNFANSTKKKTQVGATIGARTENFVLAIIWSAVLAFMSIGFIMNAVAMQSTWSNPTEAQASDPKWTSVQTILPLTAEKFVGSYLPAFMLLVIFLFGTIIWLTERAKDAK